MAQQSEMDIATKDAGSPKYERTVTLGSYTIGVYYPQQARSKPNKHSDYIQTIRSVPPPPSGWEHNLDGAVKSLQNPTHKVGGIIDYLPDGTVIEYPSKRQNPNNIPIEVGIAEEVVGADLERVVAVVELWLKRRLNGLQ